MAQSKYHLHIIYSDLFWFNFRVSICVFEGLIFMVMMVCKRFSLVHYIWIVGFNIDNMSSLSRCCRRDEVVCIG